MRPIDMNELQTPPQARPQLYSLQVLRFVAAFAVVLFHFGSGLTVEYNLSTNYFGIGAAGVDIFFVLSGFIICYSANPARGSIYFFRRRIARVVPLYWLLTLGLIVIALFWKGLLNSTVIDAESVIKSFLFIPYEKSNGMIQPILFLGWTLCYEMFFYLVFGICLLAGRNASWFASGIILTLVLIGRIWPEGSAPWRFYTNPILVEFVIGMLIYNAYMSSSRLKAGSNVVAVLLLVAAPVLHTLSTKWAGPGVITSAIFAATIVLAFLVVRVEKSNTLMFFVLLGDASYSLYLIHPYTLQFPVKLLGKHLSFELLTLVLAATTALTVIVSIYVFRWIEKPAQDILLGRFKGFTNRTTLQNETPSALV